MLNDEVGQGSRVQLTARCVQAASKTFSLFEYVIRNRYCSFHTASITDGCDGVNSLFPEAERRKSAARFTAYAGFVLFEFPCFMKDDRKVLREQEEIHVRGVYGEGPRTRH